MSSLPLNARSRPAVVPHTGFELSTTEQLLCEYLLHKGSDDSRRICCGDVHLDLAVNLRELFGRVAFDADSDHFARASYRPRVVEQPGCACCGHARSKAVQPQQDVEIQ
eukprot:952198-Rhodomonas_salina.9